MLARIAGWEEGVATDMNDQDKAKPTSIVRGAKGELRIRWDDTFDYKNIGLFDLQGRKVLNKTVNGNVCELNTSAISPGVYVMSLTGKKAVESQKIVIGY